MQGATGGPLAGFAAVDSWVARRRTQNPSIQWAEPKILARGGGQPDRVLRADQVPVSPSRVFDAPLMQETSRDRFVDSKELINKFLESDYRKVGCCNRPSFREWR